MGSVGILGSCRLTVVHSVLGKSLVHRQIDGVCCGLGTHIVALNSPVTQRD